MCGRYTLHLDDLGELRGLFDVQRVLIHGWVPRYNIAPSQPAPVVLQREKGRTLEALRWGLVPRGAKDLRVGSRLINARVETVATRPSFREAFAVRRCVVPATGYFEWRKQAAGGGKQPLWIRPKRGGAMALAGLFESWVSADGEALDTFAIVTTQAAGVLQEIHDRMPLELRGVDVERWLRADPPSATELRALARSAQDVTHLGAQEVGRRVNTAAIDGPECVDPPAAEPAIGRRQLDLFE